MSLVLYVAEPSSVPGIGASPPSWMCEALLVAKRIPFRRVPLSFARGEHKSAEMLARNPRGTIPVLTDGDATVYETLAVMLYVESLAPGHLPHGHRADERAARATALTRLFEAEHLKSAGMTALAYVMRTNETDRDPAVLREHARGLFAELERWDRALRDRFAAGSHVTLADFVLYPYAATLRHLGLSLARWPRVAAHHDALAELDAFASTRPPAWGEDAPRDPWAVALEGGGVS